MKKLLFLVPLLFACNAAFAGITFKFTPNSTGGITPAVRAGMEREISALLTEINAAAGGQRALNLSSIRMEPAAKRRFNELWKTFHLKCDNSTYVSNCLNDMQGYQVRNIKVTVLPIDNTYTQSRNRELTISLNRRGEITGVRLALESNEDVSKILQEGNAVSDMAERREILKWVEDYRCYYNEKNIDAIDQIFSDDALIITGSVVTKRPRVGDDEPRLRVDPSDVRYKTMNKVEYINNLRGIFARNEKISVTFDNISVSRDGSRHHIYGVKLKQVWNSSTYSDEGWLFLLWDFGNKDHPQIHVRTWQPGNMAENDVFSSADFF